MRAYLHNYGWHFNHRSLRYACSLMMVRSGTGDSCEPLEAWSKGEVEQMLMQYGIIVPAEKAYDAAYLANMCKADYLGRSVPDEAHLAMYVKDSLDDVDGVEGRAMHHWYDDMTNKGIPVYWEDLI